LNNMQEAGQHGGVAGTALLMKTSAQLDALLRPKAAAQSKADGRSGREQSIGESPSAIEAELSSPFAGGLKSPDSEPVPLPDDEADLVAQAKAGEALAFEKLVNRYERRIYRLARNITQSHEDAEDVTQEAFLNSFKHLAEFEGNSRFYTWLVRITVNQALMKLRKRRPNQVSLDSPLENDDDLLPREVEDWGPSPEEQYSQKQLASILSEAISQLEAPFRIVFQLRDVEDLSTLETAQVLGISVPSVKSRLLRARLKLRKHLNKYFRVGAGSRKKSAGIPASA
jgi:RNA polymerase sigma-70 factor (ECF subfamily)